MSNCECGEEMEIQEVCERCGERRALSPVRVKPLVRLFNAIKDAVNEMDRCPGDSIQDIWNEMLDKWETGLRMDRNHNIEPNKVLTGTEPAAGSGYGGANGSPGGSR